MNRKFFPAFVMWGLLISVCFGYSGWIAGKTGNALAFDSVNDYVDVPEYKGIVGTQSRTCSAWIKTTTTTQNTLMNWGGEQNGQRWFFRVESNGILALGVGGGYVYTTVTVNNGQWHHVAAVLTDDGSPSVNEILLYIDGVLRSTGATSTQSIQTIASYDVTIGAYRNAGTPTGYFNGLIDDVRIYNRALQSNELDLQVPMPAEGLVAYWAMDETEGNVALDSVSSYHGILRNMYSGGNGTEADPYRIATKENLLVLAVTVTDYSKCFILIEDIDLEGQIFTTAIIAPDASSVMSGFQGTPFTGTFDGNGHKITNFTINGGGGGFLGLFGCINSGGQIKKLGIETCIVSGSSGVGSLAGYFYGGSISNCYSTGSTINGSYAGGLVGVIGFGSISRCYSASSVTGTSNIGGLVGYNEYSGSIAGSFWDTQTSGRTTSAGGTGKTTAQMKMQSTFTSAGWDFVNTWFMPSNDYPRLIELSLSNVPDLIGMTQTAAQTAITAAGLTVGKVAQTFSDSVPAGNVISQSPAAGISVGVGSLVNLVVSLGVAVAVPDVVGMSQMDAQTAIISSGLIVGTVQTVYANSIPAGNIISQLPTTGTLVPVGAAVNLVMPLGNDGSGTVQDPYQITSKADLLVLAADTDNYNKSFILTADIDMEGQVFTTAIIAPDTSSSDGFQGTVFTGIFDGDGHVIRNVIIISHNSNYVGLFGCAGSYSSGSQIRNLGLESANVTGSSFVGGLIGYGNYAAVHNCYMTGIVAGFSKVGGLVGSSSGSLDNCHTSGIVTGASLVGGLSGGCSGTVNTCYAAVDVTGSTSHVGGLIGSNGCDSVTYCYATGAVAGGSSEYVGGLIGYSSGPVSYCHATGFVSGSYRYIGGLIGLNYRAVSYSHATGSVIGISNAKYIGGLTGENYGPVSCCYATGAVSGGSSSSYLGGLMGESMGGSVSKCYAMGPVTGGSGSVTIGGLIGSNSDIISNCYAMCSVNGSGTVGGLIGYNSGSVVCSYATGLVSSFSSGGGLIAMSAYQSGPVTNCFWDTEISGMTASAGGTGKTTAEMKMLSTFIAAGWDFSPSWLDGDFQDWIFISEGSEYPKLKCQFQQTYSGGSGTQTDPYQIADVNDLLSLADTPGDYSKKFILTADIDLEGQVFMTAIIAPDISSSSGFQGTPFTGIFDGSGHKIGNFVIHGGSNSALGLIGQIGIFGEYKSGESVKNLGIENFSISGNSGVGGLAGSNYYSDIHHCYSNGIINGASFVGGLIGTNSSGNINYCYAKGMVNGSLGSQNVGGLIGLHFGTVSFCYSTVLITGDSNSQYLGGLTGQFSGGSIFGSYATGSVTGGANTKYVGGFVGYSGGSSGGKLNQCYSTGYVSGTSSVGGLVGDNYNGNTSNSFWDIQTSGLTVSDGGTGKTTAEMQSLFTFTSTGWDFVNGTNDNLDHTWFIREGQEYPRLLWEIENDQSGLFPISFVTINKTRVGRTSFEYELAVMVRNSNDFRMSNVQLKLMDWDTAVQSVLDDSIAIDIIPAGAMVTSTDTFKIVVDRSIPVISSRLTWELTYYVPGGTVQQAMMSMSLSALDAIAGDITADGSVNLEDFAVMSMQWNTAPGTLSADIALPLDGYVGIEDLIYFVENWLE